MNTISFAHLADIHLGAFKEKKLKELNKKQFEKAIDIIIQKQYDFILISGDIFNVPLPPLEYVECVIENINKLKKNNILVYVIGGSHDYSLTHKSFIEILHSANVWTNVGNWKINDSNSIDLIPTTFTLKNLKFNICGVLGKRNGLDEKIYKGIENQTNENKCNIFMFHTTISELLPNRLEAMKKSEKTYSLKILPKGFNYYAGGHIHNPVVKQIDSQSYISYSGPIFPNSFAELKEKYSGFIECNIKVNSDNTFLFEKPKYIKLPLQTIHEISINCNNKESNEIINLIHEKISKIEIQNSIILLELYGEIKCRVQDLELNTIIDSIYEKEPLLILKQTSKLITQKQNSQKIDSEYSTIQDLHSKAIEIQNINKVELAKKLLELNTQKHEDEKINDYEQRVISMIKKTLNE